MIGNNFRFTGCDNKKKRSLLFLLACLAGLAAFLTAFSQNVCGAENEKTVTVEFFYENVCAACEGDADFYSILDETIPKEERRNLNIEVRTYNVFLDSCKVYYDTVKEQTAIPDGTDLPVLVVGNYWVNGYDGMEEFLREQLLETPGTADGQDTTSQDGIDKKDAGNPADATPVSGQDTAENTEQMANEIIRQIKDSENRMFLLFTTNACDDCEQAEDWIKASSLKDAVITCNIIEENGLELLKCMFRTYEVPESDQVVPALFVGNTVFTGKDRIQSEVQGISGDASDSNQRLIENLENARSLAQEDGITAEKEKNGISLAAMAGAGLLAGLNPCSISMLLMLLSLILSEKASVWKNGMLYLLGKYGTYFAIGFVIYFTASQIPEQTLNQVGRVADLVLVVLLLAAACIYLRDAVHVYRQDYGHIRTQLPVGLRKINHKLIRKLSGKTGVFQPLLILFLGIAISFGEFFCTGQIYMASISYMLKDHISGVWAVFLVYVTAMSMPAFIMILLIQRTRNTEHVSEFMLRHLGVIKIWNAILFFGFAVYFLIR